MSGANEWETVTEGAHPNGWERTERLAVPAGWLYRTTVAHHARNVITLALTFVPGLPPITLTAGGAA